MASPFADRLAERDRRALRWGAVASALIVAVAALLPTARAWTDREARIASRRTELARWKGIAAAKSLLAARADDRSARLAMVAQRPAGAPSEALVAASLQSLLQRYADESQLTVSELNVAPADDTSGTTLPTVPVTLVGLGDIYAVADLLSRVQGGPTLLSVRSLSIQVNPSLAAAGDGELLQVTLLVHAPFVIE